MSSEYCESQIGGNCRMHAINNFFGKPVLSVSEFEKFLTKFNEIQRAKWGVGIDIDYRQFDYVYPDQMGIIGFVLRQFGIYARYIPIGGKLDISDTTVAVFTMILDHVWVYKKLGEKWYKFDSLIGMAVGEIPSQSGKYGFIVPLSAYDYLKRTSCSLADLVLTSPIKSVSTQVSAFVHDCCKDAKILDVVEIYLAIISDIFIGELPSSRFAEFGLAYQAFFRQVIKKKYDKEYIAMYAGRFIELALRLSAQCLS